MTAVAIKTNVEFKNQDYWIIGTRVSLDSVVYAFRKGATPESIVQSYSLLTLEKVYGAITFYLANRSDIDAYLIAEEEALVNMPQPPKAYAPEFYQKLMVSKAATKQA